MELSEEIRGFSALLGRPVCDQSGRRLGRVFEARAHWDRDGAIVLDALLVGPRGLWERLRGPRPRAAEIPWEALVEVRADRIVVRR